MAGATAAGIVPGTDEPRTIDVSSALAGTILVIEVRETSRPRIGQLRRKEQTAVSEPRDGLGLTLQTCAPLTASRLLARKRVDRPGSPPSVGQNVPFKPRASVSGQRSGPCPSALASI